MWPNPQFPSDLVTFTGEILNGKSLVAFATKFLKCVRPFWNAMHLEAVVQT